MFEKIYNVIEKEIAKISSLQIEQNKIFVLLNEINFSFEYQDRHSVIHCLSFI